MTETTSNRNKFHPDLDESMVPVQRPGYSIKKIPCCLLLMDDNDQMVLKLNDTGVLIWHMCTGTVTVGDMLALLRESYPENSEVIERDVFRVLDTFNEYAVIELSRELSPG